MAITFFPDRYLNQVLPKNFKGVRLLKKDFDFKKASLHTLASIGISNKKNPDELESLEKVVDDYQKKGYDNGEALLKNRIANMVKFNAVTKIQKKYKDEWAIWLPSSAQVPDHDHMLNYGKKFRVSEGINGELPAERWGCQCGMQILTEDEELEV